VLLDKERSWHKLSDSRGCPDVARQCRLSLFLQQNNYLAHPADQSHTPKTSSGNIFPATFVPLAKSDKEVLIFAIAVPVPTLCRVSPTTFLAVLIQLFAELCCKPDHWNDQKPSSKVVWKKFPIALILLVLVISAQPQAAPSTLAALVVGRAGSRGSVHRRELTVREQGSDKLFYTALPLEVTNV